jgi:FixJ family two-component response regulator
MNLAPPVVLVVDDDRSVREAITNLVRSAGFNVLAYASARDVMHGSLPEGPCCLVLDVRLPGLSGLELQQELRKARAAIPIIFITGYADIPMTVQAMKAGAVEFLPKPFREADLLDAVRDALTRATLAHDQRLAVDAIRRKAALLTQREEQVMHSLLTGLMNKQVAAELGISEITVKIHRGRILKKMAAASMIELALMVEKLQMDGASLA